jgi:hypothetical protein
VEEDEVFLPPAIGAEAEEPSSHTKRESKTRDGNNGEKNFLHRHIVAV